MRPQLLPVGLIVSALVPLHASAQGGGARDSGEVFRTVYQPDDIFEAPNPNLAEPPPPAPLPVPPAPAVIEDESGSAALPPVATPLDPPAVLEAEPEGPLPYNFDLTSGGITWIPGDGDRLGILSFGGGGAGVRFGEARQLTGTFELGLHLFDGPNRTDLPSKVFDVGLGVGWRDQIDESWAYEIAVAPGVYADFEGSARDGVRILGHGIVWYGSSPESLWALGVASLDRETIAVLPVVGVVHRPDDMTRLELIFPRPKLARRLGSGDDFQRWLYVSGEYGGGSWAIERYTDEDDVLTLNDLRLIAGIEWLDRENGPGTFLEIGYVFDREVRYRSGRGDYDPSDALMLRMGGRY